MSPHSQHPQWLLPAFSHELQVYTGPTQATLGTGWGSALSLLSLEDKDEDGA